MLSMMAARAVNNPHALKVPDVKIPAAMLHMFENLNEPCAVKNLELRFVYANSKYIEMIGLQNYDIVGDSDLDVPSHITKHADHFRNHDRLTMASRQRKASLEIHEYGKERKYDVYHFNKFPFYNDDGELVGTWFHGKPALNISTDIFINKNEKVGSIMLCYPDKLFTDKEWDVIFFLLRRFSQKEIAKILCLSTSRINTRVCEIYSKVNLSSASQLCDFIREKDWHTFVPEQFALRGHIYLG